jgi:hypothetical protein
MRYRLVFELFSTREFPHGNAACGCEMVLPLAADRRLDLEAWQHQRHGKKIRRFWHHQRVRYGELRHDPDGWFLAFGHGEQGDEALFERDEEVFEPGARIGITEFDGQTRSFLIVALGVASS